VEADAAAELNPVDAYQADPAALGMLTRMNEHDVFGPGNVEVVDPLKNRVSEILKTSDKGAAVSLV
jgi:hypothetical protein